MGRGSRTAIVLVLGLLLWGLVLHQLYGLRLQLVLEQESLRYVLVRIPRYWPALVVVGAAAAVLGAWGRRRLLGGRAREGTARRGVPPAAAGLAVTLIGMVPIVTYRDGVPPAEWSGLAAACVAASLIFFSLLSRRPARLLAHAGLAAAVGAAWLGPRLSAGHRERVADLEAFCERETRFLERKRAALEAIDPSRLWRDLAPAGEGAGAHHFEEHLGEIRSISAPGGALREGILFDAPGRDALAPHSGFEAAAAPEGGLTQIPRYPARALLRNRDALDLDPEAVGAFLIRMKVSAGRSFRIHWNWQQTPHARIGVEIPLGPAGAFHTYQIREGLQDLSQRHHLRKINYFFLMPSDEDASVEIASVRILDRASAVCRDEPVEAGYEDLGGDTRRVLYTRSPSEVVFPATVPALAPALAFGTAVADPRIPATLEIAVRADGREKAIFTEASPERRRWSDHSVDLSPWAGRSVEIAFRSRSEAPNVAMWSDPVLSGEGSRRPNVVIFLVDCLRADHLGAYGYGRNTSPFLDALAREGALFERAFANGCHTKHSIPALFSSNPVTATGVRHTMSVLPEAFPTLTEILRGAGYATAAFAANANAGTFSGTHQGFARLVGPKMIRDQGGSRPARGVGLGAENLFSEPLDRWLEENARRSFFLYLHTMDAHGPYDPPEEFRSFLPPEGIGRRVARAFKFDPRWLAVPTMEARMALYDGAVAYGDTYLKRFVEKLESLGLRDRTLLVFTADHGEYFGEHGMTGHNPPPYVQGTRIPLVMVLPGRIPAGVRVRENVQMMDLMPTILDAAGLRAEHPILQGRSLLPLIEGREKEIFEERAIYQESQREGLAGILHRDHHFLPEKNLLFDLSRDPDETAYVNEFVLEFGLKARLRALSRTYGDVYGVLREVMASRDEEVFEINPETLQQLRGLGYIN